MADLLLQLGAEGFTMEIRMMCSFFQQKKFPKLPQTVPVIRCIFEVLSNEHHIVFLTDEDDLIKDVVTMSMLTHHSFKNTLRCLFLNLHQKVGISMNDI